MAKNLTPIRTLVIEDMTSEEKAQYVERYNSLSEREQEYFNIMSSGYGVLNIKGKPGMAKSAIARAVATKMGMAYKDVRLSMVDETDVGLFPHLSEVNEEGHNYHVLDHAVPRWAREANERPTIIHFEELNRASLQVRNAALQLLLEKEIGTDFKFNPSVLMMSSGNLGEEDGTDVEEFDGALNNRLVHVNHDLLPEEWLQQYGNANVHPLITQFIHAKPEEFYKKASSTDGVDVQAYATPRTWEMLSEYIISTSIKVALLAGKELTRDDIMNKKQFDTMEVVRLVTNVGHSYIGNSVRSLTRYLQETLKLSIQDVLSDFKRVKKQLEEANRDKKSELLNNLKERDLKKLKGKEVDNLIGFLGVIQEDERVAFLTHIVDNCQDDELRKDPYNKILKAFKGLLQQISDMS